MPVTMQVMVDDPALKAIQDLEERVRFLDPVRRDFGERMVRSVRLNFSAGGRPNPWKPTKKPRGKTLIESARLMNSITYQVDGEMVAIGTNVVYAAAHQFGVDKQVSVAARTKRHLGGRRLRAGKRNRHMFLPARPFLLVQTSDLDYLHKRIAEHLKVDA